MPRLLVVHHTASPTLDTMLDAVLSGARQEGLEGVEVVTRAALAATASDVLAADALVLGTPANMGYMSGALKVFFDGCYYPCLHETPGLPFGLYVHGNDDVTGAVRSVLGLAGGLRWSAAAAPVEVVGACGPADLERLRDLGGVVAAATL